VSGTCTVASRVLVNPTSGGGRDGREPLVDRLSRLVVDVVAARQQRTQVGRVEVGDEVEGEQSGIDAGADVAHRLGLDDGSGDELDPLVIGGGKRVADGAGARGVLVGGACEEAAPGKAPVAGVLEPGLEQRPQPAESGRELQGRLDHGGDEDGAGRPDRGELELLLGAEVGDQAALADRELGGQPPDGDAFEALDGGDVDGLAEDDPSRAVTTAHSAVRGEVGGGLVDLFVAHRCPA
jgi:hypothetical protein